MLDACACVRVCMHDRALSGGDGQMLLLRGIDDERHQQDAPRLEIIDALESLDDVQDVYSNAVMDEA